MKRRTFSPRVCPAMLVAFVWISAAVAAENIDPLNDDSQYSYGENVGWFNWEPLGDGGPGVEVQNLQLTGYIWGENIGWIHLQDRIDLVVHRRSNRAKRHCS